MNLQVTLSAGVQGVPEPCPALTTRVRMKAYSDGDMNTLMPLPGTLTVGRHVVSDQVMWGGPVTFDKSRRDMEVHLRIPLSEKAIAFIERERARTDDTQHPPLQLELALVGACQPLVQRAGEQGLSPSGWPSQYTWNCTIELERSAWLRVLTQLGWQDYRLVEIPNLARSAAAPWQEANGRLDAAAKHLRDHEYEDVAADCYQATEIVGKKLGEGANIKAQMEDILGRCYGRPSAGEAATGDGEHAFTALNALTKSLRDFTQPGRHATPNHRVSREEAEFIFATTSAWMSLVGRRLTRMARDK